MAGFCMRLFLLVALPVTLSACAQGFESNGDDDDSPRIDAPFNPVDGSGVDAPVSSTDAPTIDAPTIPIDAPTSSIDASTGTCTTSADCGVGNCCNPLTMVCQVALPLPPPLDCILPS